MTTPYGPSKACSKCGVIKALDQFSKDKNKKDGRHHQCKACRALYYTEHREDILAYSSGYYTEHREDRLEYSHKYYASHREKAADTNANYRVQHPDYHANYRASHREEIAVHSAARRSRTKLSKEDRADSTAHRKEIKDDPCYYCNKRTNEMHYDHKIPLSRGGTDHAYNIVRACSTCNLRKGAKTDTEFLEAMSYRERAR